MRWAGRRKKEKEGKESQILISWESWALALPPCAPVSLSVLQKAAEASTTPPAPPGWEQGWGKREA